MIISGLIEVKLDKLVYGGDALGRLPDGRAVFVPFGLPGETVRLRILEDKPHHARAELVEILDPSPQRILPRCPHYGVCGGCQYQHLTYEDQLTAKTAILKDQLERIGKLKDIPLQPIVPSPLKWNYRNHVEFQITPQGQIGYARQGSHEVIPIRECHLPEPPINEIWPLLEIDPSSGIQRVSMRLGSENDIQIRLDSEDPELPEFSVEDLPVSVVHSVMGSTSVLSGSPQVWMEVLGRTFRVSVSSFFQVNTWMAGEMVNNVLASLPLNGVPLILDVYCGVGLFSAFLAQKAAHLIGIEISSQACVDFEINLDDFDNVDLYEAPAEDVLPHLPGKANMVLVDPPRSGMKRAVLDSIIRMGSEKLVYVSCDPASLARDARYLVEGGFRLMEITPFDLFPQTYSIESISYWRTD